MTLIPIKVLYTCTKTFVIYTPDTWLLSDDLDMLYAVDSRYIPDLANVEYFHMDTNKYIPISSDLRLRKLDKEYWRMKDHWVMGTGGIE